MLKVSNNNDWAHNVLQNLLKICLKSDIRKEVTRCSRTNIINKENIFVCLLKTLSILPSITSAVEDNPKLLYFSFAIQ